MRLRGVELDASNDCAYHAPEFELFGVDFEGRIAWVFGQQEDAARIEWMPSL